MSVIGQLISTTFSSAASPTYDPYYANVSLLLHADGTNGSTSFPDNSPTPKTVTANGNAQVSTSVVKYGTGSSFFDTNSSYLSVPDNSDFDFGSGDFTIECWLYISTISATDKGIIAKGPWPGSANNPFLIYFGGGGELSFYFSAGSGWVTNLSFTASAPRNQWIFLAVTRSGSTIRTFYNGTLIASYTFAGSLASDSNPLTIGSGSSGNNNIYGYVDDIRITKGVARYISNFTPPTQPFPNSGPPITSQTFSYTGAIQDFTVPTGVSSINVKMWGAGGGGSNYISAGGGGGYATSTLSVTPGQQYQVLVGGGGLAATFSTVSGGFGGGGPSTKGGSGGGRSALMTSTGDPLYSNVQTLMHMEGVSGSDNYLDSSNARRSISVNGTAYQNTTQKKFGSSSAYFDGGSNQINISNSDGGLNLTGNFTVEAWIYVSSIGTTGAVIGFVGSTNTRALVVRSSGLLAQSNTTNSTGALVYDFTGTTVLSAETWYHVVWERSGTTQRLYLNGAIEATRTSSTSYLPVGGVNVGCIDNSTRSPFSGYIDEVRITVGAARYNGTAFTPPTAPFPSSFYQDVITAGGGGGGGTQASPTEDASGGAGGGTTGQTAIGSFSLGGGGTQTAGGDGGNPPGTSGGYGQSGEQYIGGSSNVFVPSFYSGGGGGGGYYGGGGGGYYSQAVERAGGGGGGAGFGPAGVTLIAGSGTTPGNSSDPIRNGAGVGGAASGSGSAPGSSSDGTNGLVYISW